jgi:hypothetical protein
MGQVMDEPTKALYNLFKQCYQIVDRLCCEQNIALSNKDRLYLTKDIALGMVAASTGDKQIPKIDFSSLVKQGKQ